MYRQSDLSGVRTEILAKHFLNPRSKGPWTAESIKEERSRDHRSFWDVAKARKRHFIFEFSGQIYTAASMVMEQSYTKQWLDKEGNYRQVMMEQPYRNDECPISLCSGYVPYDMLALHGVHGPSAQQRVANLTNYGEEHPPLRTYDIDLGMGATSAKVSFTEGDIVMMYGPPNAGKNVAADYIAKALTDQGLRCCIVDGFETRAFSPKSIPGWLSVLDRAADTHDVIFCDGMTDLIVKGQAAKAAGGADNEHAIEGPKWFSGLAASRKMVFWMANTMDQADVKILEARRTMYTGKFSAVVYCPGRKEDYKNTVERGSGFGARVAKMFNVPRTFIEDGGAPMKRFTLDVSLDHRVQEMRDAIGDKAKMKLKRHFDTADNNNEEEQF